MRIHIQNPPGEDLFAVTEQQWHDAVVRAGPVGAGHRVTFGNDDAAFAMAMDEAEALVASPPSIAGRFPCHAPSLSLIFCLAAGVEKLAPFDRLPEGVIVVNNRGVHGAKAGEFAAMALLMLNTHFSELVAAQREGVWRPIFAPTLRGKRVTVIGVGDLGGAAARQARHFGARITGVRTRAVAHPDCDEMFSVAALDEVLPGSEFLVLACPLTPATRNLMNRRRLATLPKGAGLVNIGRGALWDQDALCDLLESGQVGGAVVDVFAPEPLPVGHRMWTTRNLMITPHISADSPVTYNPDSLDIVFSNLEAWREGRTMPNQVDLARGY
jgi:phosphoglycerate dehydrogenase-like enzyme